MVKVIAGWISCLLLGIAVANLPGYMFRVNIPILNRLFRRKNTQTDEDILPPKGKGPPLGNIFTLFASGTVFLASIAIAFRISNVSDVEYLYPVLGGIILIGMGLLQIGFTNEPLFISIGLLTITSGFEIIYALIDSSVLVAGLLAIANLGIAMVGVYLLTTPIMEHQE